MLLAFFTRNARVGRPPSQYIPARRCRLKEQLSAQITLAPLTRPVSRALRMVGPAPLSPALRIRRDRGSLKVKGGCDSYALLLIWGNLFPRLSLGSGLSLEDRRAARCWQRLRATLCIRERRRPRALFQGNTNKRACIATSLIRTLDAWTRPGLRSRPSSCVPDCCCLHCQTEPESLARKKAKDCSGTDLVFENPCSMW